MSVSRWGHGGPPPPTWVSFPREAPYQRLGTPEGPYGLDFASQAIHMLAVSNGEISFPSRYRVVETFLDECSSKRKQSAHLHGFRKVVFTAQLHLFLYLSDSVDSRP